MGRDASSDEHPARRTMDESAAGERLEGSTEVEEALAMEGGRVIETWDDLLDIEPGTEVLVPLEAPLAEAVWVWARTMEDDNPVGRLSRGVRDVLLGLHESNLRQVLEAVREILLSVGHMMEEVEKS